MDSNTDTYPLPKKELERLFITMEQIHLGVGILDEKLKGLLSIIRKRTCSEKIYNQRENREDDLQLLRIELSVVEARLLRFVP